MRETGGNRECILEPEHLIGRSPSCALVLGRQFVSSQHAVLRWNGECWEVRDLGSRNGTFVNGQRIVGPGGRKVGKKARIAFGHEEVSWELVDDAGPVPMLMPRGGGAPVVITDDLLALPTPDDPQVTIFRDSDGLWRIERADEVTAQLAHGDQIAVNGAHWRFCYAASFTSTMAAETLRPLDTVKLLFSVSKDEEHVELRAMVSGRNIDLGASGRYYLLLTLARQRLGDRNEGTAETSCGWMYQDNLMDALDITQQQLNIDVFRIRRHFQEKGLPAAASIIERRPRTRQLRFGFAQVEIFTL